MFDVNVILQKADLLEYVTRAGGQLKGGGSRYHCVCPLHGGADNPTAFSVFKKDGKWLYRCFTGNCNKGQEASDAITFVEVWQGLNFKDACEWIMGGKIEDAQGMKESAERRLEEARLEAIAAKEKEDARRNELRVAETHLRYHKNMGEWAKDLWTQAGIDEGMQEFWTLGACDDFSYKYNEEILHTPTLTIPIFNTDNELMTIQHRLLNPKNPKDKYRPERAGLHSHPFLAIPAMGYDGGIIFVMEGSKKAMVTWTRCNTDWQCIGVPSQGEYKGLIETLKPVGKKVVVIPDPNSERNPNAFNLARELAAGVGGKVIKLHEKIDDFILKSGISEDDLFSMVRQARKA